MTYCNSFEDASAAPVELAANIVFGSHLLTQFIYVLIAGIISTLLYLVLVFSSYACLLTESVLS